MVHPLRGSFSEISQNWESEVRAGDICGSTPYLLTLSAVAQHYFGSHKIS